MEEARLRHLSRRLERVPVELLEKQRYRSLPHQLHPQLLQREAGAVGVGAALDLSRELAADARQRSFEPGPNLRIRETAKNRHMPGSSRSRRGLTRLRLRRIGASIGHPSRYLDGLPSSSGWFLRDSFLVPTPDADGSTRGRCGKQA